MIEQAHKSRSRWFGWDMIAFRACTLILFSCSGLAELRAVTANDIFGFSSPVDSRGTPTYTLKSGLQISIDSNWTGGRGYRPVRITVSSAKPVTGDTQITVRFAAGGAWPQRDSIVLEQDLELQQGTSTISVTMFVPQYFDWNYVNWEVWVDGKKDEELTYGTAPVSVNNQSTGLAVLCFISKDHHEYFDFFSQHQNFSVLPQKNLPPDWKHYSTLDFAVIHAGDLKRWSVTTPTKFAHLLRWVRAGGNLWVVDGGPGYENLEAIENSLNLSTVGQVSQSEEAPKTVIQRGWQYLPLRGTVSDGVDAIVGLRGLSKQSLPDGKLPKYVLRNSLVQDSREMFVARGYGMGTIVAFKDFEATSPNDLDTVFEAINQTLLRGRLNWAERHGNDPSTGNEGFGKFLIPDVGTAPVVEFQLLISLFVLAIGPLNYWFLKRRKRLPVMLLTVPAAALATTVLLFAYGFFADGFGVRVRARSLTMIDQSLGEAICWARLSYYAGVAPSKGLTMPNDTLVYPIHPARSGNRGMANKQIYQLREVVWSNEQRLTRGWLASRTPTQYLTISARPSNRKISFEMKDETFTATNELGTEITTLVVRDHEGNFYMGTNIDAKQTSTLEPAKSLQAILALRKLISASEPQYPAGLDLSQRSSRRRSYQFNNQAAFSANGLLEDYLGSIISPISTGLGNGVYYAITVEGPEVSLGLDEIVEASSFHVIRGTWSDD